jgi:hypothetical protein
MRTYHYLLTIILFSFFLMASHCRRDSPELIMPPITDTGANTIGVYIDGEVWTPYKRPLGGIMGSPSLMSSSFSARTDSGYSISISGRQTRLDDNTHSSNLSIYLYLSDLNSVYDTFYFDETNIGYFTHRATIDDPKRAYQTSDFQNRAINWVHFHYFDTINEIMSGTFSFDAESDEHGIRQLRDGRFDMRFGTVR